MRTADFSRLERLRRTQEFLNQNADSLGRLNDSASRAELDAAVARVEAYAVQQAAARVGATSGTRLKNRLREKLRREHMGPIAAIAQSPLDGPLAIGGLRVPLKSGSDANLIASARAMASMVEPHSKQLSEGAGLGENFVAELQAATAALERALAQREHCVVALVGATSGIRSAFTGVVPALRTLDALVVKHVVDRPDLLSAWETATRLDRRRPAPTHPSL